MKVYAAVAVILSVLLGLLPAYIAKTTDLGDELCDPVFYYASGRTCILLWDRTLIFFVMYFSISMLFFIILALIWRFSSAAVKLWMKKFR